MAGLLFCWYCEGMKLEDRFWSKVDKSGECWLWTASTVKGYGRIKIAGTPRLAHRVAYTLLVGPLQEGVLLDHACHNHRCVRPHLKHVRPATYQENGENRANLNVNNKSGYRGVSWSKVMNKWLAQVGHQGKSLRVGYFDDVLEAAEAVRLKRIELFTYNHLDH